VQWLGAEGSRLEPACKARTLCRLACCRLFVVLTCVSLCHVRCSHAQRPEGAPCASIHLPSPWQASRTYGLARITEQKQGKHTHTCTHARRSQQIKLVKGGARDEPEGSKQVIYVDSVLPAITLAYLHAENETTVYDAIAATPYFQVRAFLAYLRVCGLS